MTVINRQYILVETQYPFANDMEQLEKMDAAIEKAAGRTSDHSGAGMGYRDHQWDCTAAEAEQLKRRLDEAGFSAEIRMIQR
jgi:hypothetical protein